MALPTMVDGQGPRFFGVYPALVTKITEDPSRLGRVQVRFPGLGDDGDRDVRAWATLCSPYADDKQGLQIMPEVDSQVVVAFEAGDFRRPYIVGAAWNGQASEPHAPERNNDIRLLRTRADSRLEFDDSSGSPKVSLTTKSGHKLVLDAGRDEVTVTHSNGSTIKLNAAGEIEISAKKKVTVTALKLNVKAGCSTFSGVVNCTTLNASAAITSPMYSTGIGNLW